MVVIVVVVVVTIPAEMITEGKQGVRARLAKCCGCFIPMKCQRR